RSPRLRRLFGAEVQEQRGVIAPAALTGMGLAVLFRRPRFFDLPEHEAGVDEPVDVFREGAIEPRHGELRRLRRGIREAPALDPAGGIEILADHPLDLDPILVAKPTASLGDDTGMCDAEDAEHTEEQPAEDYPL